MCVWSAGSSCDSFLGFQIAILSPCVPWSFLCLPLTPQTWMWVHASDTTLVTFKGTFSGSVTLWGTGGQESKLKLWDTVQN